MWVTLGRRPNATIARFCQLKKIQSARVLWGVAILQRSGVKRIKFGGDNLAACSLRIELDDPDKVRTGGEIVTGNVVVHCDKDANCKGLEVSTVWATHGRGNIDSGAGELQVVFEGRWQAGQQYRYPFKLKTAVWPPTYYGTYINVSHNVRAKAKLAWATDPKTEFEFPVVAVQSPTDLAPTRAVATKPGIIGYLVIAFVSVILLLMAYFFILLIIPIAIIGGIVWFFKKVLPTFRTGKVTWTLQPQRLRVAEITKGHFELTPRWNLRVNGVSYTITCVESCSSGSGSNRKTHTHELHRAGGVLEEASVLRAGQLRSFDFEFRIPEAAPPSMKLVDNEVTWSVEMRIDIPKWPDWAQKTVVVVEPSSSHVETFSSGRSSSQTRSEEEQWFDQVIAQLQESGDDMQRRQVVLDAIREHEFTVALTEVETDPEPPTVAGLPTEDGRWFVGYQEYHDLDVMLFVPAAANANYPKIGRWQGKIGIMGYDDDAALLIGRIV
jgi:hypothetical protein